MASHPKHGLVTVAQHIIEQQRNHPTATGQFSWLLSGITLATKIIESHVRRAGITNVLGDAAGWVQWALKYIFIGAVVVVPIWLVHYLWRAMRGRP